MLRETSVSVVRWARLLDVSTSGYYAWRRALPKRNAKERQYRQRIKHFFDQGQGTYGPKRICGLLRKNGNKASYHRVARLMADAGLYSTLRCHHPKSLTDSRLARQGDYPNLVKHQSFKPFEALSSDITQTTTSEGKAYICQIRDLTSNLVLAHQISNHMDTDLVLATLKQAHQRWALPETCIFHSDRGSQYTAKAVTKLVNQYHWQRSFSALGKPGDNAWSESFFAIMKKELIYQIQFKDINDLRAQVFAYIETFYNRVRVQARLDYLAPVAWLSLYDQASQKVA